MSDYERARIPAVVVKAQCVLEERLRDKSSWRGYTFKRAPNSLVTATTVCRENMVYFVLS